MLSRVLSLQKHPIKIGKSADKKRNSDCDQLTAEPGTDFFFFFFNYNKGCRQDTDNMAEKADRIGASQATPRANIKKRFI